MKKEWSSDEIDHHVRTYVLVFKLLLVLTVLTVVAASLELPMWWAVVVALLIASVKGSMVAGVFMHLAWERHIIFVVLMLTLVLLAALLLFPILSSGPEVRIIHGS